MRKVRFRHRSTKIPRRGMGSRHGCQRWSFGTVEEPMLLYYKYRNLCGKKFSTRKMEPGRIFLQPRTGAKKVLRKVGRALCAHPDRQASDLAALLPLLTRKVCLAAHRYRLGEHGRSDHDGHLLDLESFGENASLGPPPCRVGVWLRSAHPVAPCDAMCRK